MNAHMLLLQTPGTARRTGHQMFPAGMLTIPARKGIYLPPHLRSVQVVSGSAWVVYLEQDYLLNPGMEMKFADFADVLLVPLSDAPLVLAVK